MGDEKAQDNVIVLSVGEFTSNNEFRAWSFTNNGTMLNCVKYQSDLLGKKMFVQQTWPKAPNPDDDDGREIVIDEPVNHVTISEEIMEGYGDTKFEDCRYSFHVSKDELGEITTKKVKDETVTTRTRLCNFVCVKLVCNNGYMERNHGQSYDVMLVSQRTKWFSERNDERIYYLALNDNNRKPHLSGYDYIDVEVKLENEMMRSTSDIKTMFSNAFAQLQCEMTFSHLMQLIMIMKTPPSRALPASLACRSPASTCRPR